MSFSSYILVTDFFFFGFFCGCCLNCVLSLSSVKCKMSSAAASTGVEEAGKAPVLTYDLTLKFMKYLDPHLSCLMLDFIEGRKVCSQRFVFLSLRIADASAGSSHIAAYFASPA